MTRPVAVEFPLRGEWVAPQTPGTRVPSHGTDLFGQRYAYDFVGVEAGSRSTRFYKTNALRYLVFGVELKDTFGWGKPIFAASDGVVVEAYDGMPERNPVNVLKDTSLMIRNARKFQSDPTADVRELTGNYVMVESKEGYFVYAHAQTGSVRVARGEIITRGQHLANVGHSGNSTAPHLHFHLMDDPDPRKAQGILCSFSEYQVLRGGEWETVRNGIPTAKERIRKLPILSSVA